MTRDDAVAAVMGLLVLSPLGAPVVRWVRAVQKRRRQKEAMALRLLVEHGPCNEHALDVLSGGALGAGVRSVLGRLEKAGCVQGQNEPAPGAMTRFPLRRRYTLTETGTRRAMEGKDGR